MPDRKVIILSLGDEPADGGTCATNSGDAGPDGGVCGGACHRGSDAGSGAGGRLGCTSPRVPVLACRDALIGAGAQVELVMAGSDAQIDAVIARLDGPPRPDGLTWPSAAGDASGAGRDPDVPTLIVAADSDGQVRAVVRRMVRRFAPPPSRRPSDLVDGRTLADLPALGVLPLAPSGGDDLAARLGLPRDPADVAKAVLGGRIRRLDLFRTDSGSVTLHGALLGGVGPAGQAAPWTGRIELDDLVLADGREPVLACAVANANGYAHLDAIALAPEADAGSGTITVGVAVPVVTRSRFGRTGVRIEVRRASGRAVSVTPTVSELPFLDDGVEGTLTRKRSWWVEPGAWAAYTL